MEIGSHPYPKTSSLQSRESSTHLVFLCVFLDQGQTISSPPARHVTVLTVSQRPTGRVFFTESRNDGSMTIVEATGSSVKDILPERYAAGNTVYNYGGAALDALSDGRVIFSNAEDNTVKILNPDTGEVEHLVGSPVLRYSDFSANDGNDWVVATEEDHTVDTAAGTKNRVVAIHTQTGEVKRIVEGPDFVYVPEFSHDGTKIAWLEWDNPDMPWYGARLYWAEFDSGHISHATLIAGGLIDSVVEPRWSPDGTLFFGREVGAYRQLFRLRPGGKDAQQVTLDGLEKAEFGELGWFPGSRTYAPLSANTLIASACFDGANRLIAIALDDGSWKDVASEEEVSQIQHDHICRVDDNSVIVIASGSQSTATVRIISAVDSSKNTIVRRSTEHDISSKWISEPELLSVAAKQGPERSIRGFLWMPRNPDFTSEANALPPLIIVTHGGPTGHFGPGLSLRTQYFTSRGYAVVNLNYHGSTGLGRAYRQALWGNWGILDADDAAEVANHLVLSGRVRKGAVGCTGLSAGGYNTLQCITRHPSTFAAAVDVSGICDLESFNDGTHKLEYHYTDALVMFDPNASNEEKLRVYKERSALYHVDKVHTPLLILHGKEDTVVPMNQATDMEEALRRRGRKVRLVKIDNDGHVLAKPPSARIWLDEEEKWWRANLI